MSILKFINSIFNILIKNTANFSFHPLPLTTAKHSECLFIHYNSIRQLKFSTFRHIFEDDHNVHNKVQIVEYCISLLFIIHFICHCNFCIT